MLFLVIVAALVGIGFCAYCLVSIFALSANSKNWYIKILGLVGGIIGTVMMIIEFVKTVKG